ncbi:MAG: MCE family protein [Bdellovibrionales bacterium]|nr:MCE family protein [Bdellovibrionales bacterium]
MKPELKVGIMFLGAIAMVTAFAFYLGILNPFSNSYELNVAYNYAGGIEVGSPVRVMGIKVGKVKEIRFDPNGKMPNGEETKLLVRISVSKQAWPTIRTDSQFFINLAGVIGEKFVEVSPGTTSNPEFDNGQLVRGEDPPRIDQLISQSYGLAGKIFEFVENNQGSVVETITMMNNLVSNLNKLLKQVDQTTQNKDAIKLIKNMSTITEDMAYFTQKIRTDDGQKTIELMKKLIWRLEPMDGPQIRKFLQEEGIKAKMF